MYVKKIECRSTPLTLTVGPVCQELQDYVGDKIV